MLSPNEDAAPQPDALVDLAISLLETAIIILDRLNHGISAAHVQMAIDALGDDAREGVPASSD